MKAHNEFDEHARRKLEEREFPFQESHWLAVEKALGTSRKTRGLWAGWNFLLPLILLIGAGAYMLLPNAVLRETEVARIEEMDASESTSATESPFSEGSGSNVAEVEVDPPLQSVETVTRAVKKAGVKKIAGINESSPMRSNTSITEHEELNNVETTDLVVTPRSPTKEEAQNVYIASEASTSDADDYFDEGSAAGITAAATSKVNSEEVIKEEGEKGVITITDDQTHADRPITMDETDHGNSEEAGKALNELEPHSAATGPEPIEDRQPLDNSVGSIVAEAITEQDAIFSDTAGTGTLAMIATTSNANDTITAVEPLVSTPPLVDPGSPFEIGIHGGLMTTTSRYGGTESFAWSKAVRPMETRTAGAELMRMGRNIGVGAGLHYSTYSERIRSEEVNKVLEEVHNYYYITTIDTSFLMITDSIEIEGEMFYTGQTVTTSVNVLQQSTETLTYTQRLREARDQVNRTSYLEIPLLFDLHVVQGRWNLGIRGGPTAALISLRSGALPNATFDGYNDLADRQFRAIVLGYTGRAYVRYRFNAGWSVGVEPMVRGHLMNSFEPGELSRRPAGWGGILSLNYRFR